MHEKMICSECGSMMILCGYSGVVCPDGCTSWYPYLTQMYNLRQMYPHQISNTPLDGKQAKDRAKKSKPTNNSGNPVAIPKRKTLKSIPGQRHLFGVNLEGS